MNRAVHGDIVVVQLLPEDEWTSPEKLIRLRDTEGKMKDSCFSMILFLNKLGF